MPIFMIGYDLVNADEGVYQAFDKEIEEIADDCWHCLDSTWLIELDATALDIVEHLKARLPRPRRDKLLVMRVNRDAAWTKGFDKDCLDWLEQRF